MNDGDWSQTLAQRLFEQRVVGPARPSGRHRGHPGLGRADDAGRRGGRARSRCASTAPTGVWRSPSPSWTSSSCWGSRCMPCAWARSVVLPWASCRCVTTGPPCPVPASRSASRRRSSRRGRGTWSSGRSCGPTSGAASRTAWRTLSAGSRTSVAETFGRGVFMSAQEALDFGLIDEICRPKGDDAPDAGATDRISPSSLTPGLRCGGHG